MEKEKANLDMEVLLLCKKIQIQHKLFCFEFREHSRAQFLRISYNGSSISVPSNGIPGFLHVMDSLSSGFQQQQDEGFCKVKELKIDHKVFCFEIGWMRRGYFLKVWEASPSGNQNTSIIIPSANNGWELFKKTLAEIDKTSRILCPPLQRAKCSADAKVETSTSVSAQDVKPSEKGKGSIEKSKMLRAGVKKFFFDHGSNWKGDFLKISEVMCRYRSSIIVPRSSLQQFHEMLGYFLNRSEESVASTSLQQNSSLHIGDSNSDSVEEN